ncbi:MAG: glycine/sarcosine/betaine reductase component B subunit [Cloacibacillus evryensis]
MKLEPQKAKSRTSHGAIRLPSCRRHPSDQQEESRGGGRHRAFKTLNADLARPGESVRICPVKDAIQPRYKTEGAGQIFPGMLGGVDTVGSGKTSSSKERRWPPAGASSDSRRHRRHERRGRSTPLLKKR